ncbi:MAG: aldehyde dehydrogenase [Bacteroidales bacterium]|nr:aldehyde dehydrogenase [Bacteroidales bacterium]
MTEIIKLIEKQRVYFNSNSTKPIAFRKEQLIKLKSLLKNNEEKLNQAIYEDFNKSAFETYVTELGPFYHEINLALSHLKKWARPKKVRTNLVNIPGRSFIYPEPFGNTLIIGAWNYPFNLSLSPLIPAIAAGNTVILKPSELSKKTSQVLAEIINYNFPEEYLFVYEGGVNETTEMLKQKFDKIFFTGSTKVGKIVMEAAAKNLTPVTLELGGKSPAFIFKDANLRLAARRICWGKFLNAGQTCIAPDYLVIEKSIKNIFLELLVHELEKYPGKELVESESYVKIINTNHTKRLLNLIDKEKIYFGGDADENERFISPTILDNITFGHPVMEEEIFGPILPVIEFENLDEVINKIKTRPKPLALYVFSTKKCIQKKIINEISFGGGTINDTIMHLANSNLPFGGVGYSGIGSYHGKTGFISFSHFKSVLYKTNLFEPYFKYPPYSKFKLNLIKRIFE